MQMLLITDNTDAMIGMRLAGVESVRVKTSEQALEQIDKAVASKDVGILIVTSGVEKLCPDKIFELKRLNRPLLSVIPDSDGGGRNENAITDYIRDAIGIKI